MLAFNYRWPELNFDRCNEVFVYNTSKFWKQPRSAHFQTYVPNPVGLEDSDQVWDFKKFAKLTEG